MIDRRGDQPRVRARRERRGRCPACGRKVLRKKTFTKMLEPGQDLAALKARVQQQANDWQPDYEHGPGEYCPRS